MNKKAIIAVLAIVAAAGIYFSANSPKAVGGAAASSEQAASNVMTLYYSPTCPHCHKARAFLAKIEKKYPGVKFEQVNTSTRDGSAQYFAARQSLNIQQEGVPLAVFGGKNYILGYGDDATSGARYEEYIKELAK
ncbi:MAG: hypothetical protein LBL52_00995 [Rickettsiales bacterium]|jgi:glutaredoxin|nr:hypothetical protein [Rickettsiales bacterium]